MQQSFIHINIGSNIRRGYHVSRALSALRQYFNQVTPSSVYQSAAVGFEGGQFYNLGVNAYTNKTIAQVNTILHQIEDQYGRVRQTDSFCDRTIDLDLILFDDVVDQAFNLPRNDMMQYAFILAPLAELIPTAQHPVLRISYHTLWQQFSKAAREQLTKYPIDILNQTVADEV